MSNNENVSWDCIHQHLYVFFIFGVYGKCHYKSGSASGHEREAIFCEKQMMEKTLSKQKQRTCLLHCLSIIRKTLVTLSASSWCAQESRLFDMQYAMPHCKYCPIKSNGTCPLNLVQCKETVTYLINVSRKKCKNARSHTVL